MTFDLAVKTLIDRCDAERANQQLDDEAGMTTRKGFAAHVPGRDFSAQRDDWNDSERNEIMAFITSMNKRQPGKRDFEGTQCVVQNCDSLSMMPVCQLHYAELVCGKKASLPLRNNWGDVRYDAAGRQPIFPAGMPEEKKRRSKPPKARGAGTSQ